MKLGFKRGEKGFTLIEIIIVLAVMAVLAAVIVPNVGGFLERGKERGWNADQNILQAAVDSYRTDIGKRAGNPWPTLGNLIGVPADTGDGSTANTSDGYYTSLGDEDTHHEPVTEFEDQNSFIDIGELVADGYLKSTSAVKSADWRLNTTADNTTVCGSYGWYINSAGLVDSIVWDDADNDLKVGPSPYGASAAELIRTSGFEPGVYP